MNQRTVKALSLALCLALTGSNIMAQTKVTEPIGGQSNKPLSVTDLSYQVKYQRAFEVAQWSMSAVAIYKLRTAAFVPSIGLDNNVISASPLVASPSKELLTANSSTSYITAFTDLKNGPVVLNLPKAGADGMLYGQVVDHWQRTIADVGPSGLDKGEGGNYLLTPPGYKGDIPAGYIHVASPSYRIAMVFRSIKLDGKTDEDAFEYARRLKLYYQKDGEPTQQRFVDSKEARYSTLPTYDHNYFKEVYEIFDYENVEEGDKYMLGMLQSLGIEKGKPYSIDEETKRAMDNAMSDLYHYIQKRWEELANGRLYWKDRHYTSLMLVDKNRNFSHDLGSYIDIDARVCLWAAGTLFPLHLPERTATEYLISLADNTGEPLKAGENYKITVPKNMPVAQFWALTIYDRATFAFIYNDLNRTTLSSYDLKKMKTNKDGSVTLYVGPTAPAGLESNWIPTSGKRPAPTFRYYGPTDDLYNGNFKMPDFEKVSVASFNIK